MKIFLLICIFLGVASSLQAQELVLDEVSVEKAVVVKVLSERKEIIPGTSAPAIVQELEVRILSGSDEGRVVAFENDYIPLDEGERFYIRHEKDLIREREVFAVLEPDRTSVLLFFTGLFLALIVVIGGKQGVRGFLALSASIGLIVFVFFPLLLKGYPPVLTSISIAAIIVVVGAYVTHGWNRTTTSAVFGMLATLIATGALSALALSLGSFSGIENEEAVYLNFDTRGVIDFRGLMLGGILIGLLGVLYDAAIGQAVAVEELYRAGMKERKKIFERAIRMGREHIGALVNTLAIAYVGASLPLLLLFYNSAGSLAAALNREIFAAEILRMTIGGAGVMLAIPATTFMAILLLSRKEFIHKG